MTAPDDRGPDFLRDMADPAAYRGARQRGRTLVTAVWCVGAAAFFILFAVLAVLTGAPIAFALVCVGLAAALGLASASAFGAGDVRAGRRRGSSGRRAPRR